MNPPTNTQEWHELLADAIKQPSQQKKSKLPKDEDTIGSSLTIYLPKDNGGTDALNEYHDGKSLAPPPSSSAMKDANHNEWVQGKAPEDIESSSKVV